MYKLLGDESGLSRQERICVVGGFVGSQKQWDSFDVAWKKVLDDAGVEVFHGLQFWDWHLDENNNVVRDGPYQRWTDEDDLDFIDSLLRVVENAELFKCGAAVNTTLFFELSEDERRFLTTSALYGKDWNQKGKPNDPWFAAFQSAIVGAAQVTPKGEVVNPIFDRRDSPNRPKQPEQDKAREVYNEMLNQSPPISVRDRLGASLTFSSKESLLGLQAADLLCNRSRVYVDVGFEEDPLSDRLRNFLEQGRGFVRMLGIRGIDLLLRGCPFRSTFWKTDEFKAAEPDYLEVMRGRAGLNVVAYKGARSGHYYSHHLKPEKVRKLKKIGVSGDLVYIASPDE